MYFLLSLRFVSAATRLLWQADVAQQRVVPALKAGAAAKENAAVKVTAVLRIVVNVPRVRVAQAAVARSNGS